MMKIIKMTSLGLAACLGFSNVQAEGLSTSFTMVSNYKSRGQDQTQNQPAIQGGFEYEWKNGFYLGNWNSTVSWDPAVSLEADIYGGYRGSLSDFDYSLGLFRYGYPGYSLANTVEFNIGIGYKGFELKYTRSISDLFFTYDTKATYWSAAYTQSLGETVSAMVSLGHTNYANNAAANDLPDYTDFRIGLDMDVGNGFTLSAGLAGANRRDMHGIANKPRFILGLTKSM
jgi:uncharacterized protein (TIGR02001 family)